MCNKLNMYTTYYLIIDYFRDKINTNKVLVL